MNEKNLQRAMMALSLMAASVLFAAPPTNLSLSGIVSWVTTWGHVASGTGSLPTVGAVGERYTDLSIATAPKDYRSDGSAWRLISGGGGTSDHAGLSNLGYASSGHTGFASTGDISALNSRIDGIASGSGVSTHSALANLDFSSSGHTGFASSGALAATDASMTIALASTAALTSIQSADIASLSTHTSKTIDPHGATETISQTLQLGSGTPDAYIERSGAGLITIASWGRILPTTASPTSPATGTLWMDVSTSPAKLRCYDGTAWNALW